MKYLHEFVQRDNANVEMLGDGVLLSTCGTLSTYLNTLRVSTT